MLASLDAYLHAKNLKKSTDSFQRYWILHSDLANPNQKRQSQILVSLDDKLHAKNLGYQLPTSQDIDNQKIYDESLIREEAQLAKLNQKQ